MHPTDAASKRRILEHPAVARARALIQEWDARTLEIQTELTEIPAPPFGEQERAARMMEHFEEAGLEAVRTDEVGNVRGRIPDAEREGGRRPLSEGAIGSPSARPPTVVMVSAHLDTVFPEGTDVRVREEGDRLVAPGISDDGRGLAALVTLARLFVTVDLDLERRIEFVATVGEEGEGDLRGVRHLFSHVGTEGSGSEGGPPGSRLGADEGRNVAGFISLDGAGLGRIVTRGLGVRRLRLTVTGPGGHSWIDRDAPNPIHALGRAVSQMCDFQLPGRPPAGLTVSRWGGGSSINAVPGEAWVELDLRSESGNSLRSLEERVRRVASGAVAGANAEASSRGWGRDRPLTLNVEVIGDRPAGSTDPDSALVEAAINATRAVGQEPELVASSTDSNVPMSVGIPAITMGAGGEAGNAHTPDEWFRNRKGPDGVFRAFLTLLLAAGPLPPVTGGQTPE